MEEEFYPSKTEKESRKHFVKIEGRKISSRIEYSNKVITPPNLFKYYKCNEYSLKVLREGKIWASNPGSFNDPFDCSPILWDGETFPYLEIKKYLIEKDIASDSVDKYININQLREMFCNYIQEYFGIFCLNEKIENDPFWAYYGDNHKGFCINFKTNELNKFWRSKPFKIEYVELERLIGHRLVLKNDDLFDKKIFQKLLRWITIKKLDWSPESEWRYLFWVTPFDSSSRKRFFPKRAIESIILGYKFFSDCHEEHLQNGIYKYGFNLIDHEGKATTNYNFELLKFIKSNFNYPVYQIALSENLKLYHQRILKIEIDGNSAIVDREFSQEQIDIMNGSN